MWLLSSVIIKSSNWKPPLYEYFKRRKSTDLIPVEFLDFKFFIGILPAWWLNSDLGWKGSLHAFFYFYSVQLTLGVLKKKSFQIDSINSCSTLKKLQFWLKSVSNIYFLMLKPMKGKLGYILKIRKKRISTTSQKFKN